MELRHQLHCLSQTGKGLRKIYLDSMSREPCLSPLLPSLTTPLKTVILCLFFFGEGGLGSLIVGGGLVEGAERASDCGEVEEWMYSISSGKVSFRIFLQELLLH